MERPDLSPIPACLGGHWTATGRQTHQETKQAFPTLEAGCIRETLNSETTHQAKKKERKLGGRMEALKLPAIAQVIAHEYVMFEILCSSLAYSVSLEWKMTKLYIKAG